MSLWQKPENDRSASPSSPSPSTTADRKAQREHGSSRPAAIGQSVQIEGELSGQEDLIIDGKFDGKIVLDGHHLTVGPNGRIHAEVHAKSVQVNGEISGNIVADDKVEISPSGSVLGDITAPRVALADGSSFKGSIDMSNKPRQSSTSVSAGSSSSSVNRDVPIAVGAVKH